MKKLMSALLAAALLLTAALAQGEAPADGAPADPPAATAAPVSEPTAEPESTTEPEPTVAPESEPTAEPTVEQEPTAEPTVEQEPEPTPEPGDGDAPGEGAPPSTAEAQPLGPLFSSEPLLELPGDATSAEGYAIKDGQRQTGTLRELLEAGAADTIYVSTAAPVTLDGFRLALLRGVKLLPDPDAFAPGFAVALRVGGALLTREDIDAAAPDATVFLTISVERESATPGGAPTDPPAGDEIRIHVEPLQFAGNRVWQRAIPEFRLSGIPEGAAGYGYAAICFDERFIPLSGDAYLPADEGVYKLRFAILDAQGDVVNGASELYELWLDFTPPELSIEVSSTQDYTMTLHWSDALSGVEALSMNGGETWTAVALGEGLSAVHTEARKKIFPPQTILLRDAAGNVRGNEDEIVLDKLPTAPSLHSGGGGRGSDAPAAPHASGDGDAAPYDAYELELPEGAVDALTLGGEAIDLGLRIDDAPAPFTAELTAWAAEESADVEPAKDTLVIRAEPGESGAPFACTWRVNGSVLRKLYNTEISYLALAAGDALLALPTVGFTAGTRYAELKMAGVSTAEFEYEIVMRLGPGAGSDPGAANGWNLSRDCAVEIWVEVAGERFAMVDRDATPEMYPFDVYCGPDDLPDYPFGAYPQPEAEG